MGMSGTYGVSDEDEAIRTTHRALDLGVTLLDPAEVYGPLHNAAPAGRAREDRPAEVVPAPRDGRRRFGTRTTAETDSPDGHRHLRPDLRHPIRRP